MMRFCSLGSGSSGNATLVEATSGTTTTRVLVDCGFSLRELATRLARIGLTPSDLDAVFVTHEHGDHVGCAATLVRRHGVPLWTSRGTWRAIGEPEIPVLPNFARDGEPIAVGDLQLTPFTVPHDAHEPLQLCFSDGASKLGVLTDAGIATPHLLGHLQRCDALLLEFNHDRDMLARSSYPWPLKARIGGQLGHLANDTAAEILAAVLHDGLRHVAAAHLSEQNNTPELVRGVLAATTGGDADDFIVASAAMGFGWLDLR
ncbi:MBL fold metallo-hydrolase [Piscinibacter gummiphilus]|uniref:MBL fold metallo-hydrolase n=2 Tax=Piscinibacter gummiphilus TaxID=946333 RepID=A0A1W6L8D6_9BURK|nr:MBL fold metallo-hydrolase [Piscinibacter gummiphilus]GLS98328.1 MBL fold metallo-hydrolase [Piscinibacter gummiphilus]